MRERAKHNKHTLRKKIICVSNCENRNKHNADRFYYQSSRIYIQKMENRKKDFSTKTERNHY